MTDERAPVSATIIWRDDPRLGNALRSVRPYVKEIVVVCTGEESPPRPERDLTDLCTYAVGCNDAEGRIADFSAARNAALRCATQPWVMWLDSDDIVVGLDTLLSDLRQLRPGQRVLCPYWYAIDDDGNPTVVQWRERIVPNDGTYHWIHPVHETLVRVDGGKPADVLWPHIIWKHQRKHEPVPTDDRNLRILSAHSSPGDPWWELNMAHELYRHGRYVEAAAHYEAYVDKSEWSEERAFAMCKLSDVHIALGLSSGSYERAAHWARAADATHPSFATAYAIGKVMYLRVMHGGDEGLLQQCDEQLATACALEDTWTPLATEPRDREHALEMLRQVREVLRDWRGALEVTRQALKRKPGDAQLLMAESRYHAAILLDRAHRAAEAMLDAPKTSVRPTGLDIVFACGTAPRPWDPAIHAQYGAGGSETAAIHMAKRLAARGHRVRVYGNPGRPGVYDGVMYLPWEPGKPPTSDVSVVWRFAPLLEWGSAKARLLWVHDIHPINWHHRYAPQADRVMGLSKWHCARLVKDMRLAPSHVYRTRNGIDPALFRQPESRNTHRCIYSSSPDRGLPVLLDMWPEIRRSVPDATLDVYYAWDLWREAIAAKRDEMGRYLADNLERRCRMLTGVRLHGGVDQATLAREMCASGVWIYPTWWAETACISALEAKAAGLHIVTSRIAALEETAAGGWLVDGDWLSTEYQLEFHNACVGALCTEHNRSQQMDAARMTYDWNGVADEWEKLFDTVLAEAAVGTLPEFAA